MPIFQKRFVSPKMAAILNFRIFAQKLQNTKMLISRKLCYMANYLLKVLQIANFSQIIHSPTLEELSHGEVSDP